MQVHFIFPHYLPGYQSEAIKVVAGDFQPGMISKLANQTLYRMATAYFEAKRRQISPYELVSIISQYIFIAYANFPCTWSHLTLNQPWTHKCVHCLYKPAVIYM